MNYRKAGFNQKKPTEPGVYMVSVNPRLAPRDPPRRLLEGWDMAEIIFFAGSYSNAHDNRESCAHWQISTLGGLTYAWRRGTWIKGPLKP